MKRLIKVKLRNGSAQITVKRAMRASSGVAPGVILEWDDETEKETGVIRLKVMPAETPFEEKEGRE